MEYNSSIIGRRHEQEILQSCYESGKAEFIAVYGRRRIGKTYLVKKFFDDKFDFYATGVYEVSRSEQLKHWQQQLQRASGKKCLKPKDWFDAFYQLQDYLETKVAQEKIVIFIDELPWLDTPKSNFLRALDLFWNSWASGRSNIKLVVCGSATTWMTNKLLGDKGGLHNRVTRPLHLAPFTLLETEDYLKSMGVDWSRQDVLEAYMTLGGTPFYLSMLRPNLSLMQNIDELFFGQDAALNTEYGFLFKSLFNEATVYRRVVELLASKLKGMTRKDIVTNLKLADNGLLTEVLDNLVKCDFLRRYQAFGKKDREVLYQLSDMYVLFYLHFVKGNNGLDPHAWTNVKEGVRNAWRGYAFELVCIQHVWQVKLALGISGIASNVSSWTYRGNNDATSGLLSEGAQIDLVIDRNDRCIDLCEMKYSESPYELKKDYVDWLQQRKNIFREVTGTNKTLRLTMVTSAGIKPGKYDSYIQGVVVLDDLFR